MPKIYARQIRPEYQESPLEWGGYPDDIIIPANHNTREMNTEYPAYRHIIRHLWKAHIVHKGGINHHV